MIGFEDLLPGIVHLPCRITLLLTFSEARDEDQADRCLPRLIDEKAAPIVREILASTLRVYVDLTIKHSL
jgi:hypothetical protein